MASHLFAAVLVAALAAPAVAQDVVSEPSAEAISAPAQQDGQDQDEQDITVTGEKEKKRSKRVCRRGTATGSIMSKVTCRTVGEWEEITAKSIADVERLRAERRTRDHVEASRNAK